MRTLLHGGSSYKAKWYLIKWPHTPSLLPKMSHRTHGVGVERGLEQQTGHLLRQGKGVVWPAQTPADGIAVSRTPELLPSWEHTAPRESLWWGQKENPGTSSDVSISFQKIYCFNSQSALGGVSICSVSFYRWGGET